MKINTSLPLQEIAELPEFKHFDFSRKIEVPQLSAAHILTRELIQSQATILKATANACKIFRTAIDVESKWPSFRACIVRPLTNTANGLSTAVATFLTLPKVEINSPAGIQTKAQFSAMQDHVNTILSKLLSHVEQKASELIDTNESLSAAEKEKLKSLEMSARSEVCNIIANSLSRHSAGGLNRSALAHIRRTSTAAVTGITDATDDLGLTRSYRGRRNQREDRRLVIAELTDLGELFASAHIINNAIMEINSAKLALQELEAPKKITNKMATKPE